MIAAGVILRTRFALLSAMNRLRPPSVAIHPALLLLKLVEFAQFAHQPLKGYMDTKPGPAYRRFKLKPGGETPNFAADVDRIITTFGRPRMGKSSAPWGARGVLFRK